MIHHVKRSEQGYRVGEDHHNARVSDRAVRLARDWREFYGLTIAEIVRRLHDELGIDVPPKTVDHWIYYTSRNVTPRDREERVPTHRTMR